MSDRLEAPDRAQPARRAWAAIRRTDLSKPAEWLVLAVVLAIAALISYTHMRFVWETLGAPWAYLGPISVDGLFAAAWLRMRRRRRETVPVGVLALVALLVALVATLSSNVAAAFGPWLLEHKNVVAPFAYAWPAIAFSLVFELVTGHAARAVTKTAARTTAAGGPPQPVKTVTASPATSPTPSAGLALVPEGKKRRGRVTDEEKRERARLRAAKYRANKRGEVTA